MNYQNVASGNLAEAFRIIEVNPSGGEFGMAMEPSGSRGWEEKKSLSA